MKISLNYFLHETKAALERGSPGPELMSPPDLKLLHLIILSTTSYLGIVHCILSVLSCMEYSLNSTKRALLFGRSAK